MRGVSRASLAEVKERLEASLDAGDPAAIGDDLFAVVHVLDREHGLRRALSDPAQPADRKAQTVADLMASGLGAPALELVQDVVRLRWARSPDMADAVEELAVVAEVVAAERAGGLDELEDELFRFDRILGSNPDLRRALADRTAPAEPRAQLLSDLLSGKATATTLRLVTEVVLHPRGRTLERGLEAYGKIVAAHRSRLVAVVRTPVELTDAQKTRLTAALSAQYDRDIHLNIEVDPAALGGLSVQIGNEEIDGTIERRLGDIRRRLIR